MRLLAFAALVLAGEARAEQLPIEEISGVVRREAPSLIPCLERARGKGDIGAGSYTLVLDWDVKPDGSVSRAVLREPGQWARRSVGTCVVAGVRKWRFGTSVAGASVRDFPIGPVNVP
jgi:hypothetical protein